MKIKRDSGSAVNPDTIITISWPELKQLESGRILYCRDGKDIVYLKATPPSTTVNSKFIED